MNKTKRKLLQALGVAGVGATAAIPVRWVRPVVDAVVLPAHAQTSCLTSLTIPGDTFDCTTSSQTVFYSVDDTDPSVCPTLVSCTQNCTAPTTARFILFYGTGTGTVSIVVSDGDQNLVRQVTGDCGISNVPSDPGPFDIPFLSLSGVPYHATGVLSHAPLVNPTTVTFDTIVVSPE